MVATEPEGPSTRDRSDLSSSLRSLHLRHARKSSREEMVESPVHVVFYKATEADLIEIIRVLHERMEPSLRIGS